MAVKCPNCATFNVTQAESCKKCGTSLVIRREPLPTAPAKKPLLQRLLKRK